MKGWLVNDCLTCIPGTRTFWHDLLDWIPDLENMCDEYSDYSTLAYKIENRASLLGAPDYIIRNATYFRRMHILTKTISLLQDASGNLDNQLDVCNNSDVVVFNSPHTANLYRPYIKVRTEIIPIGTNFDLFKPTPERKAELKSKYNIQSPCVLYVGDSSEHPKGFPTVLQLIEQTNYNFCLVMKDDFSLNHPRVRVFNKIPQEMLTEIANCCDVIICTSHMETLHLAGIEAAACGLPVVATNVGIYPSIAESGWGHLVTTVPEFISAIESVLSHKENYDSRGAFLEAGLDKDVCKKRWQDLIVSLER